MSWHYSQALEEEFSAVTCLAGDASAPLRSTSTQDGCSSNGRTTDISDHSRSGMTSQHSTGDHGLDGWMSSLEAFRAKTSAQPGKVEELRPADLDCGNTWRGLSVRFDLPTSSWRTALSLFPEDLPWPSVILPRWGMMQSGELWERTTPLRRTRGIGSGSWPTPVASEGRDNNVSWESLAKLDKGGRIARRMASLGLPETQQTKRSALNPMWLEWLMGWPIGWTACDASETVRFQQWCALHGEL